jgi:hypothetical protein
MVSWLADGEVAGYDAAAASSGSLNPAAWKLASAGTVDTQGPTRLQYGLSAGGLNRLSAQNIRLRITNADCNENAGRRMTATMFIAPANYFPPGSVPSPSAILALGPNLRAWRAAQSRNADAGPADVTWNIPGPGPGDLQPNTKYWVLVVPTSVADTSYPANYVNDRVMNGGAQDAIGRAISIWTNRTPNKPTITSPNPGSVAASGASLTLTYTTDDPDKVGGSTDETFTDVAGIQVQYAAKPTPDNPNPSWTDLPIWNFNATVLGKGWYIDGSAYNSNGEGAQSLWNNGTMQILCGATNPAANKGVLPSGRWQLRVRTFDYGHPQPTAARPLGSTNGQYTPDNFPAVNTSPWSDPINVTVSAQVPPPVLLSPINATAIPDGVPIVLRWQYRNTHTPPYPQASRQINIREVGNPTWRGLFGGSLSASSYTVPEPTVKFNDDAESANDWTGTGGDSGYPQQVTVSGNARIRNRKATPAAGTNSMTLSRSAMGVPDADQVVTIRGKRTGKADPGQGSGQLITNGGFNGSTTGWTMSSGGGAVSASSPSPYEGTGFLRSTVLQGEDTYYTWADQVITLVSLQNLTVTGVTRYDGSTARPQLTLIWRNSGGTTISSENIQLSSGTNWTPFSVTRTPPAGAVTCLVRLEMYPMLSPGPAGQHVDFDAISAIQGVPPQPFSLEFALFAPNNGSVAYEFLSYTNLGVGDNTDADWEAALSVAAGSGAIAKVTTTYRFGPGAEADLDITHVDVTTGGTDLPATTEYEWRVRTVDSTGVASDWSETGRFWVVPAPASGEVRPLPGETIDAATLGCGKHTAVIYRRGGKRRVGVLSGITYLDWSRVRDDISTAKVVIKDWDIDCGNLLAKLQTWAYELVIYRSNGYSVDRVWEGPITLLTYEADAVTIQAKDVMAYAYRRIIKQKMSDSDGGDTVTSRAARVLQNTLGPDDPNVLAYLQVLTREDDAREYRTTPAYSRTAFEEVDDMAANAGLDYCTTGRAILLWGTKHRIGTLPEFRDKDLGSPPIVSEYGMSASNVYAVSDGNGLYGEATRLPVSGNDTDYGLVEMLSSTWASDTEDDSGTYTAQGQATVKQSFEDAAERSIAYRWPPPVVVRVPDNTSLNPSTVISIQQLVPGVVIPLRSTGTLRTVIADQKLDSVKVVESSESETITITLSPFTHDDASTDTDVEV